MDPRVLPHSIDAERSVIGAALIKPEVAGWLTVREDEFYDPRHRALWGAILSLLNDNLPVDVTTLEDRLQSSNKLEAIGGLAYLSECAIKVPTADNVEHYANIVREKNVSRSVMLALSEVIEMARRRELEGDDLLAKAYEMLGKVRPEEQPDGGMISDLVRQEYMELAADVDRISRGEDVIPGVPTGLRRLDDLVAGIPKGILSLLMARPSMGKTSMAMQIAKNATALGRPTHYFSHEDRRRSFSQRMLANESGITIEEIRARRFTRQSIAAVTDAANRIAKQNSFRLEESAGMKVEAIIRTARARRREIGTELVIIDYAQLIPWPDGFTNENNAIGRIMTRLSTFAAKDDIAILVLSQLNRDLEKRDDKRPRQSDLRGSGELEQQGKLIIGLYRPAAYERYDKQHESVRAELDKAAWECRLEALIIKNHNGKTGVRAYLHWQREICRITDHAADELFAGADDARQPMGDDNVPF